MAEQHATAQTVWGIGSSDGGVAVPCLHAWIAAQAQRTPDATAVRFEDASLSYRELDERANRWAHYLREVGVGPDVIVGVLMERRLELVVGLLAILKAGGAYLPLDPADPVPRREFMLADADVGAVLTQSALAGGLGSFDGIVLSLDAAPHLNDRPATALPLQGTGDDLAYVIFTSGSTGQPKGCMISHAAICNRLAWMQQAYGLQSADRVLQKTPHTFDVSVWEFFWPLMTGAVLVLARPQGHKDTAYLTELICRERVTVCHFVPSMLKLFLADGRAAGCTSLRHVFASGEALPFEVMRSFLQRVPARLHNLYGPTEAAVDVSFWPCEERADCKVPIGRAISNIELLVLDEQHRRVPVGSEGELFIAGVGLARGYLNRPEITRERFVANPFGAPGRRMYRTGDRVRELADGNLDYLGRTDYQVKLRGLRVELGEIESVLRRLPSVRDVAVMVRDEADGDPKLVAYLESVDPAVQAREVREHVARQLPAHMVPNAVMTVARLPVNTHGKLDRRALPWPLPVPASDPSGAAARMSTARAIPAEASSHSAPAPAPASPPALELELQRVVDRIARYAAEALRIPEVAPRAQLFDLGATSLTLLRIVERVRHDYRLPVPVEVFLEQPTVQGLADYVVHQASIHRGSDGLSAPSPGAPSDDARPTPRRAGAGAADTADASTLAVVGVAGRYPGASSLDQFWENLRAGRSSIGPFPAQRLAQLSRRPGETIRHGAYLEHIDRFDNLLFGISPVEARTMDPQERLLLETAWACLEDAGYTAPVLARTSGTVGVFVGAMWNDYQSQGVELWEHEGTVDEASYHASLANRISYSFDFQGPSVAINTSCSSAMTALHFACESIRRGECGAALVGGVNLISHVYHARILERAKLLTDQGEARPFSAQSDGWLMGEGVGAVLVKPLEAALSDGDHIHGLLLHSSIAHTGRTLRFGAPSQKRQEACMRDALAAAGIDPSTVSYVETAAAGATVADAAEMGAVQAVFGGPRTGRATCHLGSLKANIGHLEAAAPMAQLTKVLWQLRQRELAPTLNSQPLSPLIAAPADGPRIVESLAIWPGDDDDEAVPRTAVVSAVGAAGSIAHLVVRDYVARASRDEPPATTIVPVSAASADQLRELAARLLAHISANPAKPLASVAYTLGTGRVEMAERLALVVDSLASLRQGLEAWLAGSAPVHRVYRGRAAPDAGAATGTALDRAAAWVVGAVIDWSAEHAAKPARTSLPTYPFEPVRHWLGQKPAYPGQRPVETVMEVSTPQPSGDVERLREKLEARLAGLLADATELPIERVEVDRAFELYGLSSLMIEAMNERLSRDLGSLQSTLFFEHRTLRQLASHLLAHHAEAVARLFPDELDSIRVALPSHPPASTAAPDQAPAIIDPARPVDIAIVGLAGRFPGADTVQAFWENLRRGEDCITEVPPSRWDHARYFDPEKGLAGKSYSKWGGFIEGVDEFDPLFFNISPRDAELMDPQERLFLQAAWHAVEDAGHTRESLSAAHGGRVGVFAGAMYSEYQLHPGMEGGLSISGTTGTIANRVSHVMNLRGPSMTVDTMCSSSLTAIHLACESIRRGECMAAIAGGVCLTLHPNRYATQSLLLMSSTDGRCKAFGAGGDGFVTAEGVGAVLLKPLHRAEADGDTILGVIKGTSVNHGGHTNGFTVPDPVAQADLVDVALARAGVHPRTVSYVEAHGTGTALGDPIEIAGLSKAYGRHTRDVQYCAIGSVKSNIGHCESAAGIAGLSKVLLQMKHRMLVGSLHSEKRNPNIEFEKTPFVVQQGNARWERPRVDVGEGLKEYPRTAGISSFGAGGSNAHVIVQEYVEPPRSRPDAGAVVVVVSARNEERLREQVKQLLQVLPTIEEGDLQDLAYTLQVGREAMETRLATVVQSVQQLQQRLQHWLQGDAQAQVHYAETKRHKEALGLFAGDDELKQLVESWVGKGKLDKLAEAWVKGLAVPWARLHEGSRPRRMSLPTYPFAREKYWVPRVPAQGPVGVHRLHPLVHSNTSQLSEQRYSSRFSGQEFYLRDHVVQDQKVLPGVAQLEMAREAVARASGQAQVMLEDVVFLRPVVVPAEGLAVHVALHQQDDGRVDWEIYSAEEPHEQGQVHSQGRAVVRPQASPAPELPLSALERAVDRSIPVHEAYAMFERAGLDYGPGMRGLQDLRIGRHADQPFVLARVQLPPQQDADAHDFAWHPSVLDSALQAATLLHDSREEPEFMMPFSLDHVEQYAPLDTELRVLACLQPATSTASVRIDVDLLDLQGRPCLRLKGFVSRTVADRSRTEPAALLPALGTAEAPAPDSHAPAPTRELTLAQVWEAQRPPRQASWPQPGAGVLVLGDDDALRHDVAGQLQAQVDQLPRRQDVAQFARRLEAAGSLAHVVWLVPACELNVHGERLVQAQRERLVDGWCLVKALLSRGYGAKPLGLTVITRQAASLCVQEDVDPAGASVHGLIGSLAKEYEHWEVRLVDLPATAHRLPPSSLSLPADPSARAWAWRDGWHRQATRHCDLREAQQPAFRRGGVVVVLGGAGGLGEVFSEHLVREYQAQVIWIGRRTLDETIEAKQDRLGTMGPRPFYCSADASDRDALRRAHDEIVQRFGAIHGLVHATIVLRDRSLAAMEREELEESLLAKVDVSIHAADVFDARQLDFVLFFSSLMSWVTLPGQANYAAGCCFTDAHAQRLRNRGARVKVVNWGYWGEVGIVADPVHRARVEQRLGAASIRPAAAMALVERLLASPIDHVAYLHAAGPEVARQLGVTPTLGVAVADVAALDVADFVPPAVRGDEPALRSAQSFVRDVEARLPDVLAVQLRELAIVSEHAVDVEQRMNQLNLPRHQRRWLSHSLDLLQAQGHLRRDAGHTVSLPAAPRDAQRVWSDWDAFCDRAGREPNQAALLRLIDRTVKAVPDVIGGRVEAPEVLFPGGTVELVEGVYKGNPVADHFNEVLTESLLAYVRACIARQTKVRLRVLEVGAGTGGTSARLLERLHPFARNIDEYCYTDISKAFLLHGQQSYGTGRPYLTTRLFDAQTPPGAQGLDVGAYDVVIATNVLHATRDVRATVRNVQTLLKTNGVLLLNELSTSTLGAHLSFGLLEGWWLSEDDELRIAGSPLLSPATWRRVLEQEGFVHVDQPAAQDLDLGQQVFVARSGGVLSVARETSHVPSEAPVAAARALEPVPAPRAAGQPPGRRELVDFLTGIVARTLKMPAHQLEEDRALHDYGVDSILVVKLTEEFRRCFGEVSSTLLFERNTIKGLADHFLAAQPQRIAGLLAPSQTPPPPPAGQAPAATVPRRAATLARAGRVRHVTPVATPIDAIAIVGMSGCFPMGADLDEYWQRLSEGQNCIREIPAERWDWTAFYDEDKNRPGRIGSKWGGFIDGAECFDPQFFGISPREAERMDPQERLFLQHAHACVSDAGYTPASLRTHKQVAVFVGVMNGTYSAQPWHWSVANRVSAWFDLHGASLAVDTACSSSLTALHLACESLRTGQTECAIVGGVNLIVDPVQYQSLTALAMLSSGDQCRAFGDHADGFVDGEGVGAVMVKTLRQAEADGDHIHAVIKGSAINHGGKTSGYTVPSPVAQAQVIKQALEVSGVHPRTISYVEAHGTGTALGDPIEIAGLSKAWTEWTQDRQFCAIGSVKTNIGHGESAAGIAGLMKILLQMRHGTLVPSLHSETLNPNIEFERTPFVVQQRKAPWDRPQVDLGDGLKTYPRTAGLSSFGAGGANAHVIVQEYLAPADEPQGEFGAPQLVVVSSRSADKLKEQVRQLHAALTTVGPDRIEDVAYTLRVGREAMPWRLACVARSVTELRERLGAWLDGGAPSQVFEGDGKSRGDLHGFFDDDEDVQRGVARWVARGELDELGQAWVKGLAVDWEALRSERRPRRLSLPTYPFAKERFWAPRAARRQAAAASTAASPVEPPAARLHPLVHANTSRLGLQRFSSVFSGDEFFLRDHRVRGQRVLPGVAQLEMVRAAVGLCTGETHIALRDVTFLRPAIATDSRWHLHVTLQARSDESIAWTIYGADHPEDTGIVHSTGIATASAVDALPTVSLIARGDLETPSLEALETDAVYGRFAQLGLEYGPTMRGLRHLGMSTSGGRDVVRAAVCVPHDVGVDPVQFGWHPSLLDSAVQAGAALFLADTAGDTTFLPFAIEKIVQFAPLEAEMSVLAARKDAGSLRKMDLELIGRDGQVCLRVGGITSRALEAPGPDSSDRQPRRLLLQSTWREREGITRAGPPPADHWVVLAGLPAWADALASALPDARQIVLSGDGDLAQRFTDHALRLIAELQQWAARRDVASLLVQLVVPSSGAMESLRGLAGVLKSVWHEYDRISWQCLTIDDAVSNDAVEWIREEARRADPVDVLALRRSGGRREALVLAPLEADHAQPAWRSGGVYLITGGAGGIGLVFAETIAQHARGARLVLVGRRALTDAMQTRFDVLRSLGAQVHYLSLDVGDAEAVAELVAQITAAHGALHGVIHAAGVVQDSMLRNKTPRHVREVLAPKVAGAVNLHDATRGVPLDMFVMFGSIAGIWGGSGQADYAAGNAFLDAFARYRIGEVEAGRCHGRTLTIDWPLWRDGGMSLDERSRERLWRLTGMLPMHDEDGMQAFAEALGTTASHAVVMFGSLDRMNRHLASSWQGRGAASTPAVAAVDDQVLRARLQHVLIHKAAGVLRLDPSRMDPGAELGEFGFDSVMLAELAVAFNDTFGIDVNPTAFFEYPTMEALSAHLATLHRAVFERHFGTSSMAGSGDRATASELGDAPAPEDDDTPRHRASWRELARMASQPPAGHARIAGAAAVMPAQALASEPVAIIGVSGHFPQARSVEELWSRLEAGDDCVTQMPAWRWPVVDGVRIRHAGVIDGIDEFDASFFGISPKEAEAMDPSQRLLMMHAWKAIEDAGYAPHGLAGTRTAVLVGTASSGYDSLLERAGTPVQGYTAVGAVPSLGPNRVSYLLDLRGPSEPVETACSSSLVALHRAVQLLRSGQCTLALVGGVNALVSEPLQRSFIEAGMLSADGRCKTFSERANGYVRGEGVGMLVLKPLSHAQRDGDHIHGLIKGSAESHGGRASSLTAPNPRAQAELIKEALTGAGVAPDTVTYVEVHSLGTVLGDSIELQGLKSAFHDLAVTELAPNSCALGSIKSNIGHLELAAGVTGIIKILLQMRHHILAPTLHAEPISASLGLADGPFHVVTHKQPWRARRDELGRELPLRAGVSSFGLGGVIAHVVLEEYVESTPPAPHDGAPVVVVLSARTRDRLKEQATNLLQRLDSVDPRRLGDLAYTLQLGRDAMECRLSCVVSSVQELRERLEDWLQGRPCSVHEGESRRYNELRAVFEDDSELQEAVLLWVARGKLDKLASAWSKGLSIDWGALHAGRSRRRMSLPTYPFARERHWVQGPDASEAGSPEVSNPESDRADASTYEAPHDEIERTIARIWQELLGVERVGRDQNFFELGGNSLYMEALSARIRSELHVSLSARAIFSAPTVAALAGEVLGALTSMFSHEELAELRADSRAH